MTRPEVIEVNLLDLLREMQRPGADDTGFTAAEIAEKMGMSISWVQRKLRFLFQNGRVEVGARLTTRIDGHTSKTPVYRLRE